MGRPWTHPKHNSERVPAPPPTATMKSPASAVRTFRAWPRPVGMTMSHQGLADFASVPGSDPHGNAAGQGRAPGGGFHHSAATAGDQGDAAAPQHLAGALRQHQSVLRGVGVPYQGCLRETCGAGSHASILLAFTMQVRSRMRTGKARGVPHSSR